MEWSQGLKSSDERVESRSQLCCSCVPSTLATLDNEATLPRVDTHMSHLKTYDTYHLDDFGDVKKLNAFNGYRT